MAVLRFDPFREFDRLTEQFFGTSFGSLRAPRMMPMDVYRSGDHYVLHADLPGVDPGSIDVSVEDDTLTIRAERSSRTEESVEWLGSERVTGTYMRQLTVGDHIDADKIAATYENGVLTVTIPVMDKAVPRKIPVETKTEPVLVEGKTAKAKAEAK